MNILKNCKFHRLLCQCINRKFNADAKYGWATEQPVKATFTLEPLSKRELIRVQGAEVVPFLQGLVTNDVSVLQQPNGPESMYALMLNRAGRVLFDTIVYRTQDPNVLLLECDREASADFRRHLRTFRVRKKIEIDSLEDEYVPWVVFNHQNEGNSNLKKLITTPELFVAPDPRLDSLGTRILAPSNISHSKMVNLFWRNHDVAATAPTKDLDYQTMRYIQGVGEGVVELPPGKCFPLEANADLLNGVSFNKGCYMGQELTARVHHSGVIRKRYMPIRLTAPVSNSLTVKSLAGANLGRLFGHKENRGLALLRIEQVLQGQQQLAVDGERCYAEKPKWWPNNLANKRQAEAQD